MRGLILALLAAVQLGCAAEPGGLRDTPVPGSGVHDLPLAGGGVQRVLYKAPPSPVAVVVLLTGGDGVLNIDATGRPARGGNFLIRTRDRWLAERIAYVIPDVPSNRHDLLDHRHSADYAETLRTVLRYVRSETPAPIWLIGTSNGTNAAASGGVRLGPEIAGVVLTSSVTQPGRRYTEGVFGTNLGAIAVPVLITAHRRDNCPATPASDAARIRSALTRSPRAEAIMFDGGLPPRSDPCEAFSEHGYLGIEPEVIARIAAWIKS